MSHKIRLGPIALFLAVVAIVLATLAVLTAATTNADKVLAERFAGVTQTRYGLEAEGEKFVQAYDEEARDGNVSASALEKAMGSASGSTPGSTLDNTPGSAPGEASGDVTETKKVSGGYECVIERDGYTLEVGVSDPDAAGRYEITKWKITKDWNAEDPYQNVWKGGDQ